MSTSGPVAGEIATVASDRSRAALLASLPVNMESVDQALLSMMREVEGLGGELVMCRRSAQEESEEESSSWLFTRLQSPAGQP
ncbi:MAG: hypothetical protein HY288_03540 [Planctomycetia bacterium]|nr:hypothetical protein [Planctomycetia bacterium]